jgi:hypothetical protein
VLEASLADKENAQSIAGSVCLAPFCATLDAIDCKP